MKNLRFTIYDLRLYGVRLVLIGLAGNLALAQAPMNLSPTNALGGTNEVIQTNSLLMTNSSVVSNSVSSGPLATNRLSESNSWPETNQYSQTNLIQTNSPSSANPLLQTMELSPANLPAAESNRAGWTGGVGPRPTFGLPSSARLEYPAFRIISERNIFNPNRSRGRSNYQEERGRPARTEAFSLVGTMSYEKGMFAFFDGSSSEYRKALKPMEEIAGYKLTEIGYNRVKLASKSNEIELPIGMQMRREDEGEWFLGQPTLSYSSTSSSVSTPISSTPATNTAGTTGVTNGIAATGSTIAGTGSTNAATEASAGGADEILKRLMQRREETLNK